MNDEPAVPILTITEAAAAWLREGLARRDSRATVLRLVFHVRDDQPLHGLLPEDGPRPGDVVVEQHGITVVIDPPTLELVRGSRIDRADDDDSPIAVVNPNIRIVDQDDPA